jgi:quercetin dioxygenase-like cupin family protein
MPTIAPYLHDHTGGEVLNVVGEHVRLLAHGDCTDDQCAVFENISQPGAGPPLHIHDLEDEFFYIVEGAVKFSINGKETTLGPGGFVCAARGSTHTFKNIGSAPSRMIICCTPAGLERPFREASALSKTDITPERIGEIFARYGVRIVGPPLQ